MRDGTRWLQVLVLISSLVMAPAWADPADPLVAVERQRASIVSRVAAQWGPAFEQMTGARRLTHEQLAAALWVLRADRLLAVALAGDASAIEGVLGEGHRSLTPNRSVARKALGETAADSVYTPVNPCRIVDTRVAGGALAASVARNFVGLAPNFGPQGGQGRAAPSRVAWPHWR